MGWLWTASGKHTLSSGSFFHLSLLSSFSASFQELAKMAPSHSTFRYLYGCSSQWKRAPLLLTIRIPCPPLNFCYVQGSEGVLTNLATLTLDEWGVDNGLGLQKWKVQSEQQKENKCKNRLQISSSSVQFSRLVMSDSLDYSTPGFPVHHLLDRQSNKEKVSLSIAKIYKHL